MNGRGYYVSNSVNSQKVAIIRMESGANDPITVTEKHQFRRVHCPPVSPECANDFVIGQQT